MHQKVHAQFIKQTSTNTSHMHATMHQTCLKHASHMHPTYNQHAAHMHHTFVDPQSMFNGCPAGTTQHTHTTQTITYHHIYTQQKNTPDNRIRRITILKQYPNKLVMTNQSVILSSVAPIHKQPTFTSEMISHAMMWESVKII